MSYDISDITEIHRGRYTNLVFTMGFIVGCYLLQGRAGRLSGTQLSTP